MNFEYFCIKISYLTVIVLNFCRKPYFQKFKKILKKLKCIQKNSLKIIQRFNQLLTICKLPNVNSQLKKVYLANRLPLEHARRCVTTSVVNLHYSFE